MGDGNGARVTNCDVGLGINFVSSCKKNGGVMGVSGKVLFTATQWEELERQKKIYMYIMACIPVPPQLLSPLSVQSNRVSTGLKFSNGLDPEPWRCRRTDGKKWRCAKDVAPDQKYCERHAHKTRSRSRKPVETQSQNLTISAAHQQTRFMKNGSIPVSQSNNNQFQLPLQSSSVGSRNDHISKQDFKGVQPQNSYLDHDNHYLNTSGTDWSRIAGGDECSLTLSTQSGVNEVEFDDESFQMAVGMLRGDRDVYKPNHQWLNQASWGGSGVTPGGPLGEALCLGIANTQNDLYSQGYSYSTTTSSSCEGGSSHGLDFDFVNQRDD
uniref:Growth-regulating factor n=1 Tax=Helianthus tuberosus TaxID=4233 RepID=A0AB38ZF93_HELTU